MRGIGHEAPLLLESRLYAVEHVVERLSKLGKLVLDGRHSDASAKVGDLKGTRRLRHRADRPQDAAADEVAGGERQNDAREIRDGQHLLQCREEVALRCDRAEEVQYIGVPALVDDDFVVVNLCIANGRNVHRRIRPKRRMLVDVRLDEVDGRVVRIRLVDDGAVRPLRHAQHNAGHQEIILVDSEGERIATAHVGCRLVKNLRTMLDRGEHMLLRSHKLNLRLVVEGIIDADGGNDAREHEHEDEHRRIDERQPRRYAHVARGAQAGKCTPEPPSP